MKSSTLLPTNTSAPTPPSMTAPLAPAVRVSLPASPSRLDWKPKGSSPPNSWSSPSPPLALANSWTIRVSLPEPPSSSSKPKPLSMTSSPLPPSRKSAPSRPKIWSLPPRPKMRSSPSVPVSTSLPSVPAVMRIVLRPKSPAVRLCVPCRRRVKSRLSSTPSSFSSAISQVLPGRRL
ncbi:hypothetical protein D9M73_147170 [compost metagenome]